MRDLYNVRQTREWKKPHGWIRTPRWQERGECLGWSDGHIVTIVIMQSPLSEGAVIIARHCGSPLQKPLRSPGKKSGLFLQGRPVGFHNGKGSSMGGRVWGGREVVGWRDWWGWREAILREKSERKKVEDAKRPCCMMGERGVLIKNPWQENKQVLVYVLASIPTANASSHAVIVKACWCIREPSRKCALSEVIILLNWKLRWEPKIKT